MKLIRQSFDKHSSGYTEVVPQDQEDLWNLYNLIQKGDEIRLQTLRNVSNLGGNKSKSERKLLKLTILVEDIEFEMDNDIMRIKGKTTTPNEYVPVQSYHTAEIQLNKPVTIIKEEWDELNYDIIVKACSIEAKAEIGAIVLEEGIAHLCLITDNLTVVRNKIEKSIPKKRRGDNTNHDKGIVKFYNLIITTMLRNFDFDKLKVIVLASPGFLASNLLTEINNYAQRNDNKVLFLNKAKFVTAHSSTGYLQGLEEALKDTTLQTKLADTQFAEEVRIFDEFQKVLNNDDGRAWYGPKECEKAIDLAAVKYFMITDTLFRNSDLQVRKFYIDLTERAKHTNARVFIFSSLHDSGKQLDQLTGIAVVLNYPLPDLDEDIDD